MSKANAYLSLGGNLGEPREAMARALRAIDAAPGCAVRAVSSLYRTPPWGRTDQPDFLNCAAKVKTHLPPRALLELCLATERALKRVRAERWGPRLIDIDIVAFGDTTIREEGLELPHPRLSERAFVLVPLAEIAPGLSVGGHTVEAMLGALDTASIVREDAAPGWWRQ